MSDDVMVEHQSDDTTENVTGAGNGASTTEKVLNYLLFHKSLIDEKDSGARINEYVEMVEQLERGMHITIQDPFEKSIAIIFELVMHNRLDPWQIDLINFSRLYLDRIKEEEEFDFVTAGRLIFMAWSILKLQSDAVLLTAQPPQPPEECYEAPVEDYSSSGVTVADGLLGAEEPPLREMIRRQETRHVSLMELVNAFNEARKESELRLNRMRQKHQPPEIDFGSKVHSEDLVEEICLIWDRIQKFKGTVPLKRLYKRGEIEDFTTAFISILFLAFYRIDRIKLRQERFPHGEIYIQNCTRTKKTNDELETVLRHVKFPVEISKMSLYPHAVSTEA